MKKHFFLILTLAVLLMSTACSDKDTVIDPPIEENDKNKDEKPDEPKEPEEPGDDTTPPSDPIGQGSWADVPVPATTPEGHKWQLQESLSDDFNYEFAPAATKTTFNDRWINFYPNNWNGPGATYWQHDHVSVDGNNLVLTASRSDKTEKMGVPGVNAASVSSANKVTYPAYVEASVSMSNIALSTAVWLLSDDSTEEIDIIEGYGGADHGMAYFSKFIHLSHHSFIRKPFQDYQPTDINTWWKREDVTSWGEYCWNNGDRRYVRVGVNWVSPKHFEYYVDGELVRVLYENALANKLDGVWHYAYPTMTDGVLDKNPNNGYQKVTPYKTSDTYSFALLQEASIVSTTSIIDPYKYLGEDGFTQELNIIISSAAQEWHVSAGRIPDDKDLADPTKNKILVDWIRVCKPIAL